MVCMCVWGRGACVCVCIFSEEKNSAQTFVRSVCMKGLRQGREGPVVFLKVCVCVCLCVLLAPLAWH